jgi:signal recognition particle subunit SEC65
MVSVSGDVVGIVKDRNKEKLVRIRWIVSRLNIKIIRYDDWRKPGVDWKLNLKFEYNGRDTLNEIT